MNDTRETPKTLRWWKWITLALGSTVLISAGAFGWFLHIAGGDPALRIDAIRNAVAISLGFGGAWTVGLLARRQWLNEDQHRFAQLVHDRNRDESDRAHELALKSADASQVDARERRITDLYMKAADQLGSDKAPVRLAALYALDRLGEQYPDLRQVIVNIWCAYVRLPLPAEAEESATARELGLEYHVRKTAIRLLEHRLADGRTLGEMRRGVGPESPAPTYWGELDVDLSGAVLYTSTFLGCRFRVATFTHAHFRDNAIFTGMTAHLASFTACLFDFDANFQGMKVETTFTANLATFRGSVKFDKVQHSIVTKVLLEDSMAVLDKQHRWPIGWKLEPVDDKLGTLKFSHG